MIIFHIEEKTVVMYPIQQNIGIVEELESSSKIPRSAWSLKTQNELLDDFHSPQQRAQRMQHWLRHIHDKAPVLSKKNQEALTFLLALCGTSMSPIQSWFLPYLVPDIGAIDYATMSISKLNRDTMHKPKRTFRNEWWSLSGRLTTRFGEGFLSIHVLRHTNLPETLWQPDRDEKEYSEVRIVVSLEIQDQVIRDVSTIYPESWDFVQLLDEPFGIKYGKNYMLSQQEETIFPMQCSWDVGAFSLKFQMDNVKPLFMMNSNGCLVCNDQMGIKKYTYPVLTGSGVLGKMHEESINFQFQGNFEHAWEASVFPEGFSSSIALRSLINIEKSIYPLSRPDDWCYICIHLNNNIQISCYFLPFSFPDLIKEIHPTLFTIIHANGTVTALSHQQLMNILMSVQLSDDQGYPMNIVLYERNHQFSFQIASDVFSVGDVDIFQHKSALVSGEWYKDQVSGFAFLQTTNRMSYETKSEVILQKYFQKEKPEVAEIAHKFQQWAQEKSFYQNVPEPTDLTNSWLLWFLPVVVVAILIVLIVYLIWSRKKGRNKPWMKTARRNFR